METKDYCACNDCTIGIDWDNAFYVTKKEFINNRKTGYDCFLYCPHCGKKID
jgi:hypothetical protein